MRRSSNIRGNRIVIRECPGIADFQLLGRPEFRNYVPSERTSPSDLATVTAMVSALIYQPTKSYFRHAINSCRMRNPRHCESELVAPL